MQCNFSRAFSNFSSVIQNPMMHIVPKYVLSPPKQRYLEKAVKISAHVMIYGTENFQYTWSSTEYLYKMWRFRKIWSWKNKAIDKQIVQLYDLASHSCEKGLWEAQTLYLCSGVALNPNPCVNYNKAMHVPSRVLADLDLTCRLDFPAWLQTCQEIPGLSVLCCSVCCASEPCAAWTLPLPPLLSEDSCKEQPFLAPPWHHITEIRLLLLLFLLEK